MNKRGSLSKLLMVCLLIFMSQTEYLYAPTPDDSANQNKSNDSNDSVDKSKKSNDPADQNKSNNSANKPEEKSYYPFTLTKAKLPSEEVIGIGIDKQTIVFYGSHDTDDRNDRSCYVEPFKQNTDFSEINFFKQYQKLFSVEISGLKLTRDMLENLQKFLPTSLQNLIIDFCEIDHDNMELLADIIKKHGQLRSLRIRLLESSGDDANVVLAAFSERSNIKILNLAFGDLSPESGERLADVISRSAEALDELCLAWNDIVAANNAKFEKDEVYQKITDAVSKSKQIKSLEFSVMSIPEGASAMIFKSIGELKLLTELRLFFNNLNTHNAVKLFENMEVLRDSLKNLSNIESLDISNMHLPGNEMQVLLQAPPSMPKIKCLNISGNTLDAKSGEICSEIFKTCTSLTDLIANSCNIDEAVFVSLCKSLSNASLVRLYVGDNKIKNGAKSLPIATMDKMQGIDFSQNDMNYDDAMAFIVQAKDHPSLQYVNFLKNPKVEDIDGAEKSARNFQFLEWKSKNNPKLDCPGF